MKHNYNDGGRRAAGFTDRAKDCTVRAIAITTGRDYLAVYNDLRAIAPRLDEEGVNVHGTDFAAYMEALGFAWVPSLFTPYASGPTYLADLPKGRVIAVVPTHVTAVIDGVVEDTINTETEAVRGYWTLNGSKLFNVYRGATKLNSNPLYLTQALTMRRLSQLNYGGKVFVL